MTAQTTKEAARRLRVEQAAAAKYGRGTEGYEIAMEHYRRTGQWLG